MVYPASLVVLALFIAYQVYRYTYAPSIGLIVLTVLDLVVMALVWHEYRLVRPLSFAGRIKDGPSGWSALPGPANSQRTRDDNFGAGLAVRQSRLERWKGSIAAFGVNPLNVGYWH
jgi:predicted membrane protein DUF2127